MRETLLSYLPEAVAIAPAVALVLFAATRPVGPPLVRRCPTCGRPVEEPR